MKRNREYDKFDKTMRRLLAVPHGVVKAKLEAEKKAKKRKRASRAAGASRRDSGD